MAGTLKPDASFQRFNLARDKLGDNFRFKPKSALFNIVFMGIIPAGFLYFAYAKDGQYNFHRQFRKDKVLHGEDYVPRVKDL